MPSFLAESFGDANENNLHSTKPIWSALFAPTPLKQTGRGPRIPRDVLWLLFCHSSKQKSIQTNIISKLHFGWRYGRPGPDPTWRYMGPGASQRGETNMGPGGKMWLGELSTPGYTHKIRDHLYIFSYIYIYTYVYAYISICVHIYIYMLYTIYYILYTIYYILYTIYYILYTIYYILYTIYYILYTIYYILYTIYYILYTIYYILYTIYYIHAVKYIYININIHSEIYINIYGKVLYIDIQYIYI